MSAETGTSRVHAAIAGFVITLAIAACAPTVDDGPRTPELPDVSIEGLGHLTATLDYDRGTAALPSDAYDTTAPEYVARVLHAIAVRADGCMVEQGYVAIVSETDWAAYSGQEDRTLGRWSPALASLYGADRAPEAVMPQPALVGRGPEFSNAYHACSDQAKESLAEEIAFSQGQNVALDVKFQALELSRRSATGAEAIEAWRACSEDAGIVLDPIDGMPAEEYKSRGKEVEIGVYTAHAECARSSGAMQAIYDQRVRYETALIAEREAEFAAFAKAREQTVGALDEVIAGR